MTDKNPGISSPCIIPSPSGSLPKASVAIPVSTQHATPASNVEVVEENNVVQQIVVRCDCGRAHHIHLEYEPSTAIES